MNSRLPPLSQLRAFEAAAHHLNFKRAAEALSVTPAAISHQVRALEAHLGMPLFERQPRQLVLTPAGQHLYPVLQDGFAAFARAIATITSANAQHIVTLSVTPAFAAHWLIPRLSSFNAQHPDINLRLHASEVAVDLSRSDVDLAVRYGSGPYPECETLELCKDVFAAVAAPTLMADGMTAPDNARLIHVDWHRPHPDLPIWADWFRTAGRTAPSAGPGLNFSDESHAIQAAMAGQGVALLSLSLVDEAIARGALKVLAGPQLAGPSYHLLAAPERSAPAGIVARWLRSAFASAASLSAQAPVPISRRR
ncbi:LysR substrate-binding domain-containing protein [Zoogloeaceae bacterium G21618-S1]|nr:LysR substrate-binding domain-containing protein [Zoogloeaceae bacterium G21618-S1]